jgi:hypothetical protein
MNQIRMMMKIDNTYKQTTLKNLNVVNYDLKGATPESAATLRSRLHLGNSRLMTLFRSATSRLRLSGKHLLVGLEPFIEELLNRLE